MEVGTKRTGGKFKIEIVGKNAPTATDGLHFTTTDHS